MIVSDNAANIRKAIRDELKYRHFGCYAHTINLIVMDTLKLITEVGTRKSKINRGPFQKKYICYSEIL